MTLSCTSKIKNGEGIYVVSSIVHGNKVKIVILIKRTTGGSDKNDVVSPKMLSSLTKIDEDENDAVLLLSITSN